MSLRRLRKHLRRKINEAAPTTQQRTQNNTNQNQQQQQTQQQNQQQTQNQSQNQNQQQATEEDLENKPPFTRDDVEKMTPGEIINYVYVSMPPNIDAMTKQALIARANQLRLDAEANKDVQERAKQILRSVGATVNIGV